MKTPEPNGNEKMLVCGGTCVQHSGLIKAVYITHNKSNTDWGVFFYCDNAIKEDISRGLTVKLLNA